MELFFWQYDLPAGFEFECLRYTVNPGQGPLHWHNYYQIGLCVRGGGVFDFEQRSYPYREGDIFVVDNTQRHAAFADEGTTADFMFLVFYPQFVARGTDHAFDYEYLLPFAYRPERFCNKLDGASPFGRRLREALLDIEAEYHRQRQGYRHLISAKLRVILAELMSCYGVGEIDHAIVDRHRKLRPALLYLEEHCCQPVTLEQAARVVYLSPSRFRHLFRETMHVGFKEYLTGLRYQQAKRMLAATQLPVSEVALACGFSNLYRFYSLFRQWDNLTPAQYRQRSQGQP